MIFSWTISCWEVDPCCYVLFCCRLRVIAGDGVDGTRPRAHWAVHRPPVFDNLLVVQAGSLVGQWLKLSALENLTFPRKQKLERDHSPVLQGIKLMNIYPVRFYEVGMITSTVFHFRWNTRPLFFEMIESTIILIEMKRKLIWVYW